MKYENWSENLTPEQTKTMGILSGFMSDIILLFRHTKRNEETECQ